MAEKAIEQKKIKKQNKKSIEIDTSHTLSFCHLIFLRSVIKTNLKKKLFAGQEDDQHKKIRGRTFYKIGSQPSRKVLYLYNKLFKQISLLIVQIKTGKIHLKKFLYQQNIPDIEDTKCICRKRKKTVRYIPTNYLQYSKLRKIM